MFSGSIVAIITPFRNGRVDLTSLQALINWHIQEGTQAIVACGSTGESALLTSEERRQVISTCVSASAGRIPIIASCGAPSTQETITYVQEAKTLGATAALVMTPVYVKPSQEGVYQHFAAISKASSLPVIIYNNPARVVVDLSVDLVARLAELPHVIGLKDSSVDLTRPLRLRQRIQKQFCLLSGDDPTTPAYLAHGGDGSISVTANIAPKLSQELMRSWQQKDIPTFSELRDRLFPLHQALEVEVNPSPIKYGVSALGHCQNEIRLPLLPVSSASEKLISQAMRDAGVL